MIKTLLNVSLDVLYFMLEFCFCANHYNFSINSIGHVNFYVNLMQEVCAVKVSVGYNNYIFFE